MSTPASLAKHPIHPMLVAFPVGLLVFSVVCNLIYMLGSHEHVWTQVAFYTMGGGILSAIIAAIPGLIDFLSITDRNTNRLAWTHMLANISGLILFFVAFWTYRNESATSGTVTLSVL